jgi:hypothetical protein
MNFGEIRVLRFERPEGGAKTIPTDLWIDASAKLFVVDEEMPVIIDVFGAHGSYRQLCLSVIAASAPRTDSAPNASRNSITTFGHSSRA